jgi:hypothetical protein
VAGMDLGAHRIGIGSTGHPLTRQARTVATPDGLGSGADRQASKEPSRKGVDWTDSAGTEWVGLM